MLSHFDIADVFDLDLALNMPKDHLGAAETNQYELHSDAESKAAAAKELVAELPTVVVVSSGSRCTVCMEGFRIGGSGGHGKQIPCGHVFHGNCIAQWISLHDSCPLCRSRVSHTAIDISLAKL